MFARCLYDAGVRFVIFSFDVRLMFARKVFRLHFSFSDASFGDGFRSDRPVVRFFPFYPLHASQAGPQKTSQICILLLQVASLGDFYGVSDIIVMTLDAVNSMLTAS